MNEKLNLALKEFGLSGNEIIVYLSLLKTGQCGVQEISKNTKLPRTTIYHLLDSIKDKGLINFIIKDKIKSFSAASPRRLRDILNEKKKLIENVLPDLDLISSKVYEKPGVEIYEGTKGIKSILDDVLEEKSIIFHYGEIISLQKNLGSVFSQFVSQRIKKKIRIKIVGKKERVHDKMIKDSKKKFREFRFLPKNYEFKSGVFIYKDRVAILNTLSEPFFGMIIKNKNFCDTQKQLFNLLWAKK